jgi:hypothetical protein
VWISIHDRGGQSAALERIGGGASQLGLATRQPVHQQALADDLADSHPRVQRAGGVLKDDLHVAARPAQCAARHAEHVAPAEDDGPARGWGEPQHSAAECRGKCTRRFCTRRSMT